MTLWQTTTVMKCIWNVKSINQMMTNKKTNEDIDVLFSLSVKNHDSLS